MQFPNYGRLSTLHFICVLLYLLEELSSDHIGDLDQQLQRHLRSIRGEYAEFIDNCAQILIEQQISVKRLLLYISNLCTLESEKDSTMVSKLLKEAKDIYELCLITSQHLASFINCEIFKCTLMKFGGEKGKKAWEVYSSHLNNYVEKHKVSEFTRVSTGALIHCIDHMDKLVMKINIKSYTRLKEVCNIQARFADIMGINHSNLLLLDIKEGCVLLIFLISAPVAEAIFAIDKALTVEQTKELQELSIKWLLYHDHIMMIEVITSPR